MANPSNDLTIDYDRELVAAEEARISLESDSDIRDRFTKKFTVLKDMTRMIKQGKFKALVVSGDPGTGKSFGVEEVLQKEDLFSKIAGTPPKYEIVSGAMSALGLYAKLFKYSAKGNVIVFDDCDTILQDEISLNILKAALDSKQRRYINWNTDSRLLRTEGIPDRFEFCAGAIFISNIRFEHIRSKKLRDHLAAISSRCHKIDLSMITDREKLIRIEQVVGEGMLQEYGFEEAEKQEILDFIRDSAPRLQELSLRMALKVADLKACFPDQWKDYAVTTCYKSDLQMQEQKSRRRKNSRNTADTEVKNLTISTAVTSLPADETVTDRVDSAMSSLTK